MEVHDHAISGTSHAFVALSLDSLLERGRQGNCAKVDPASAS